ncbi:phosphoesterase [Metallosphaera tengchongensis]|uniref:Phosphoesterase n=1 Tax=Metallosphaera tengchongensis TaxID=1532350 RepID=A0A6N0NWU9_9CREN|nr:metallophosphoesterase [Metallosphaera tengchongensis]QKR00697.1 phosphoesterase [Metallosphaera tengchongensis]
MPHEIKILFTSDIHGSERVFKKAFNAAKMFNVDHLIFGGDMFSKDFLIIFRRNETGKYFLENKEVNWKTIEEESLISGKLPIVVEQREAEELGNREVMKKIILERIEWQAERWLKIQEEKLRDAQLKVHWNLGNDDPLEIDPWLRERGIDLTEGKVVEIDDINLVSTGYVNPTPFNTYRESPESTIYMRLEGLLEKVNPRETILNVHAPPINTKLDMAKTKRGREHVGSASVRELIEKFSPLVGLHGHVHESWGIDKIGDTKLINPGSQYYEGVFRGALLVLERQLEKGLIKTYKVRTLDLITG